MEDEVYVGEIRIHAGRSYHVQTTSNISHVIHVHGSFKTDAGEIILSVSSYLFQNKLPRFKSSGEWLSISERENNGQGRLFLSFSDWEHAGTANDAIKLPLSDIESILQHCRIQTPGFTTPSSDAGNLPTFSVEYGIGVSKTQDEAHTIIIRNLRSRERVNDGGPAVNDVCLEINFDGNSDPDSAVSWEVHTQD